MKIKDLVTKEQYSQLKADYALLKKDSEITFYEFCTKTFELKKIKTMTRLQDITEIEQSNQEHIKIKFFKADELKTKVLVKRDLAKHFNVFQDIGTGIEYGTGESVKYWTEFEDEDFENLEFTDEEIIEFLNK